MTKKLRTTTTAIGISAIILGINMGLAAGITYSGRLYGNSREKIESNFQNYSKSGSIPMMTTALLSPGIKLGNNFYDLIHK